MKISSNQLVLCLLILFFLKLDAQEIKVPDIQETISLEQLNSIKTKVIKQTKNLNLSNPIWIYKSPLYILSEGIWTRVVEHTQFTGSMTRDYEYFPNPQRIKFYRYTGNLKTIMIYNEDEERVYDLFPEKMNGVAFWIVRQGEMKFEEQLILAERITNSGNKIFTVVNFDGSKKMDLGTKSSYAIDWYMKDVDNTIQVLFRDTSTVISKQVEHLIVESFSLDSF